MRTVFGEKNNEPVPSQSKRRDAPASRDPPSPSAGTVRYFILEHGSWSEDPDFQRRWAALLANAATAGEIGKVLPAFGDILRVLTPVHARILDWMFAQEVKADIPD